jgi:hypothetical protein
MPNSFGFGSGGTSNNGASFTGAAWVRTYAGTATGNANLAGTTVTNYKSLTINGTYSNCYPSYSGGYAYLYNNGGTMYFSRYQGNGGTVEEAPSGAVGWTNGSLQGTVYWSTVPTTPASISLAKTGRQVVVSITGSSSNGGETITSYSVQYRTSSDGGSTWGSWGGTQTISGSSTTYNNLTPALTYQFRTYANNSEGSSAARSSSNVFVSSGGKRWSGSAWVATATAKRWSGSAWVDLTVAKRWNGSSWVDLS